jgi:DNA-binding beta-propeller fold protein YncE
MAFPVAVVIDGNHRAWFANQGGSTITRINSDGTGAAAISCCDGASGIAIDVQGNLWAANYFSNSVSEVSSAGVTISPGYSGGGLTQPQGIAVDGAGDIWVANYHGNTLTKLQGASRSHPGTPISGASGFGAAAGLSLPYALAIDASGNIWVTNFESNSLIEFVGAAPPN